MSKHCHQGSCHCGAVRVAFSTRKDPGELQVRACQCGFCRRHGAMTVSDPEGRVVFEAPRDCLARYQFGTRTATSLLCTGCGTYVGGLLEDGDRMWAIVNVRGMALDAFTARVPDPMVYESETAEQRIVRRKAKWTPAELSWC